MDRRVVVTGLGAITPLGNDVDTLWTNLVAGKLGIDKITLFDTTDYAVKIAADPKEKKLKDLPVWEVKKYYIHLYPEDALVLDFECPLSAFGGKSAFEVAKEAFALHTSQQSGRHEVEIDGPYDIRRYGLAYSAVGPDEAHDGLFEHIDGLYEIERSLSRNKDGEV